MARLDVYAGFPWYLEHLRPVIDELGPLVGRIREGPFLRAIDDPAPAVLVASYGDLCRARRHGYERIVLAQHGAGQSYGAARRSNYPSYPGGSDCGDVGLFLVPNEHAAARWRAAYPRARVAVVGCPKLDALPSREPGPGPVIAVSFHWDFGLCPETRSAWSEYWPAIPALRESFAVLGHGHPKRPDLARWYRRAGIEHVPGFADVLRRADVYVCDNSSSLFEFAATGRPVVVLNSRLYRPEAEHGLRFWAAAGVGVNVWHRGDLPAAIARALELRPDDVAAREAALELVYQPRSGGAAIAAAAIRDYLAA